MALTYHRDRKAAEGAALTGFSLCFGGQLGDEILILKGLIVRNDGALSTFSDLTASAQCE